MSHAQEGFTLVKLVMVIVTLGTMSAVALPRLINEDDEARQAAVTGIAGSLASASAINYASRKANPAKGVAIANCSDASQLLQGVSTATPPNNLPTGYAISAGAVNADATVSCTLMGPSLGAKTSTFLLTGIS